MRTSTETQNIERQVLEQVNAGNIGSLLVAYPGSCRANENPLQKADLYIFDLFHFPQGTKAFPRWKVSFGRSGPVVAQALYDETVHPTGKYKVLIGMPGDRNGKTDIERTNTFKDASDALFAIKQHSKIGSPTFSAADAGLSYLNRETVVNNARRPFLRYPLFQSGRR